MFLINLIFYAMVTGTNYHRTHPGESKFQAGITYNNVRIFIYSIVFCLGLAIMKKMKKLASKWIITWAILCTVFLIVMSFCEIENAYVSFSTADQAEKYYGIEVSLFSEISSLCESIVKMGNGVIDAFSDSDEEAENGKDAIKNAFFDAAGVVAKMCGIPVDNVKNVAVGIWKNVEDVTSGEGLFSFSTDKEEPKANVYGKKIYDALMDDDKKTAAQYREKMKQNGKKGEGDVETAVKDQLASRNDLVKQAAQYRLAKNHNGYMECYNKLIKMGFNHYEIVAATNSALNKMQDKTESGAKDAHDYLSFYKSDDLVAAIEEGKGYEEILQQMNKLNICKKLQKNIFQK